jgi:hypothetical protein
VHSIWIVENLGDRPDEADQVRAEDCHPSSLQGLARIGVMRALNRHVERAFDPSRKDTHRGRRKLARDR